MPPGFAGYYIAIETLLPTLFVEIDGWHQEKRSHGARAKLLTQSRFSASEVMTLMLAAEYIAFAGSV